jgi:hypothetical protein
MIGFRISDFGFRISRQALGAVFIAGLLTGCTHIPHDEFSTGLNLGLAQARPPSFLTGPMGVLLTNGTGFSAQLTRRPEPGSDQAAALSGQLLARGNELIFAPDRSRTVPKRFRVGGIIFIWDVVQHSGLVLSETLQGYAPMSLEVHATNIVAAPSQSAPERIEGHPCREALATVASSDGSLASFRVWRAADLNGVALRLSVVTNSAASTLTLSTIQLQAPPAKLFQPPDGFTKYESVEAMMSELVMRQQRLRARPGSDFGQPDLSVPSAQRRPGY